jgi:hypothetical protein
MNRALDHKKEASQYYKSAYLHLDAKYQGFGVIWSTYFRDLFNQGLYDELISHLFEKVDKAYPSANYFLSLIAYKRGDKASAKKYAQKYFDSGMEKTPLDFDIWANDNINGEKYLSRLSPGQEYLKIGDNIYDYFVGHKKELDASVTNGFHPVYADLEVILTGSKTGKQGDPILISARLEKQKSSFFAVTEKLDGEDVFLTDMNGDGMLDNKSNELIYPYWLLFPANLEKGNDPLLLQVMDIYYNAFRSDEGPNPDKFKPATDLLVKVGKDKTVKNRDLFFAFTFYLYFNQKYKEACLDCIITIGKEVPIRFKKNHPLTALFMAETCINLGKTGEAIKALEFLLTLDPDCLPALVYSCKLEADPVKRKAKYEDLISKHPKHWMVKMLADELRGK